MTSDYDMIFKKTISYRWQATSRVLKVNRLLHHILDVVCGLSSVDHSTHRPSTIDHRLITTIILLTISTLFIVPNEVKAQCTAFTVSGGGAICAGSVGATITLSGSTIGLQYQLMNGSASVGGVKIGTGSGLTWSNQITEGTYSVVVTDTTTHCTAIMTGSASVTANTLPLVYSVSGGQTSNTSSPSITLSNSQTGINYQLQVNGTATGTQVGGTGNALTWSSQTTEGMYTVMAINPTTTCTVVMTGSAKIIFGGIADQVEFNALMDIFDNLKGASWANRTNWPAPGHWPASATSAEFGTWYGITVTNGDITAISLSKNYLAGTIPPSICDLKSLKMLDLSANQITGDSPECVSKMVKEGAAQCDMLNCTDTGVGMNTKVVPAGYLLAVKGKVIMENGRVDLASDWPDYVFEKGYNFMDLPELKKYIQANGHLPNVPAASEMIEGMDVAEINTMLMQKIEELSLYIIQLQDRLNKLKEKREQESSTKKIK